MQNKKRLLVFLPIVGTYRIDILNLLHQRFECKLVLDYVGGQNEIFTENDWRSKITFIPHYLKKCFSIGDREFYTGYLKALRSSRPDVVLVSEFGIDALIAIAYRAIFRKKYKILSICDDSYDMAANGREISRLHPMVRNIVVPHLDDIILVEPRVVDWYQQNYGKGFYFPIIADEKRLRLDYANALPRSRELRRLNGLEGKNVILYVGRLATVKNIPSLIEAYRRAKISNSVLVIVGDGVLRDELHAMTADTDNIIFTGAIHGLELAAWYDVANMLVLPSTLEPFGAVTNEALIAGCYALVSNHAGSCALIQEGVNGYTINPTDIDDITAKLQQLAVIAAHNTNGEELRPSRMTTTFGELAERLAAYLYEISDKK